MIRYGLSILIPLDCTFKDQLEVFMLGLSNGTIEWHLSAPNLREMRIWSPWRPDANDWEKWIDAATVIMGRLMLMSGKLVQKSSDTMLACPFCGETVSHDETDKTRPPGAIARCSQGHRFLLMAEVVLR